MQVKTTHDLVGGDKIVKKRIGIVADDVTGANDIGIMFAKNQYKTAVFPLNLLKKYSLKKEAEGLDVIIIDTDSRFDKKEIAAEKVRYATLLLRTLECDMYHNKTCSVFRGNIGAEFDAMQDVLGINCSMVIAGFPKNYRTTVDGVHYVDGEKLEDSQFKNDPIHPMKTSSLAEIMAYQTSRKIGNITYQEIDKGLKEVKKTIEELKKECAYIIFDIRHQEDLKLIAEAIKDEKNICGSSAIGEELPKVYGGLRQSRNAPILTIAGSLTKQSKQQVDYMKAKGYPVIEFHTNCIYKKNHLEIEIETITKAIHQLMDSQKNVVVHTSNKEEEVNTTKEKGRAFGLTDEEIGKRISSALFRITKNIMKRSGELMLVVAGGDTSAAIVEGLKIYKMEILEEIETGVPTMKGSTSLGEIHLVLKSGSFGSEAFLEKAAELLKGDKTNIEKYKDEST